MCQQSKTFVFFPFKVLSLVVLLGTLLSLSGCDKKPEQAAAGFPPPPMVSVSEVLVQKLMLWEEFNGRTEAKEVVRIQPRVGGVIKKVHFREGDVIKKGDLLYTLDQKPFQIELDGAKANLARAKVQASLAKSEVERAKDLIKRKILSPDKFDQLVATENQSLAAVESAKASMSLANLNLEYTKIRSPINGRIGRTLFTNGNLVASDPTPDQLTTIFSLNPIYVVFDIDELSYLKYFSNEQKATTKNNKHKRTVFVGLGNETDYPREGFVDFVDNKVMADTGTIKIRAVLDNEDYQLIPGLFSRVKMLTTQAPQAMLISEHAILTDQDRRYVYVVDDKNLALRRDIKIGRSLENLRMVTEGLTPGDKVIVHGVQKVFFPGMPVNPQVIGMNDPPASPVPQPAPADE